LDDVLFNKLEVCTMLATWYDMSVSTVRPRLHKAGISTWGKVRCLDDEDTMHASVLMLMGEDRWDASYVQVSRPCFCYFAAAHYIPAQATSWQKWMPSQPSCGSAASYLLWSTPAYHFNVVCLAKSRHLGIKSTASETIFLAVIQTCVQPMAALNGLGLHYYTKMARGRVEVVDMNCVQCVVGWVEDPDTNQGWVLIDRSGNLARAVFIED
jgi:hypothetical protein